MCSTCVVEYVGRLWSIVEKHLIDPIMGETISSEKDSSLGYGEWVPPPAALHGATGHWLMKRQHGHVITLPLPKDRDKIPPSHEPKLFDIWRQVYEVSHHGDIYLRVVRYHIYPDLILQMRHNLNPLVQLEFSSATWASFHLDRGNPRLTEALVEELTTLYMQYPELKKCIAAEKPATLRRHRERV